MRHGAAERLFEISCENAHTQKMTATQLEEFIRSGEHECPECGQDLHFNDPHELDLECHICSDVYAVSDVQEAMYLLQDGCTACEERGFNEDSVHVPGSWQEMEAAHDWHVDQQESEPLKREGRTDYWEAVIHFCTAEEFASIYRQRTIKASATGYFRVPAVCLTEATTGNWKELQDRHGAFGFVFRKPEIIVAGGGPAIYMSESLISAQKRTGFCHEVRPFVNLLRIPSATPSKPKHDYLHEREWRFPRDLSFSEVPPYAVIIGHYDTDTKGWRDIWSARFDLLELDE
jgi:hypothetical protein